MVVRAVPPQGRTGGDLARRPAAPDLVAPRGAAGHASGLPRDGALGRRGQGPRSFRRGTQAQAPEGRGGDSLRRLWAHLVEIRQTNELFVVLVKAARRLPAMSKPSPSATTTDAWAEKTSGRRIWTVVSRASRSVGVRDSFTVGSASGEGSVAANMVRFRADNGSRRGFCEESDGRRSRVRHASWKVVVIGALALDAWAGRRGDRRRRAACRAQRAGHGPSRIDAATLQFGCSNTP